MSKPTLIIGILFVALLALGVINITQNYQTGNELDYYALKETTEAAMTDAVDIGYYRMYGLIRIDKEKFAESFLRRFAATVGNTRTYDIEFRDLNETPPKVSVLVNSQTAATVDNEGLKITNQIDAILESKYMDNKLVRDMTRNGELDYTNIE